MFPHKKLDWHISRLEAQLEEPQPEQQHTGHDVRHDLARAYLSRGLYHGGGEAWCSRALVEARKTIAEDPTHVGALITAGTALVGMGRSQAAKKYLDQAATMDPERGDLHLAYGALARSDGDRHAAVRHLENACRLAPKSWETHLYLGRVLAERAKDLPENRRLLERSQYHLVYALKLGPSPDLEPPLLRDIGLSCLQTGRFKAAEKFFLRLRENERFSHVARYHLGMVAYQLGKYNNAIQHFRQYLKDRPEDARVHARTGMAWMQLGEQERAQEACHHALMLDPGNKLARYTLGCSLLEDGQPSEALRIFKEALQENPDHMEVYLELARTRRLAGDTNWLIQALQTEVRHYDRLPPGTGPRDPRTITRTRVGLLLDQLRTVGMEIVPALVRTINLVQDESLRFQLWEAACTLTTASRADEVAWALKTPGKSFDIDLARQALAAASSIPEPVLTRGLGLDEDDLKKAAVDRCGPASDVTRHRENVDALRDQARAWQALLLLAVASRRSRSGRRMLETWADTADPELAVAARAGLAMYGDPESVRALQTQAEREREGERIRMLLATVVPPKASTPPRPVSDDADVHCSCCGRTGRDADHLMAGSDAVICDVCVLHISQHRRSLEAPDGAQCDFTGKSQLESKGVYRYQGVDICNQALELSLGLMEREEVERFLAAW